jgi:hypothetical protein
MVVGSQKNPLEHLDSCLPLAASLSSAPRRLRWQEAQGVGVLYLTFCPNFPAWKCLVLPCHLEIHRELSLEAH